MGWKETCTVEERMRFMVAVEKGEESFAAICRRFEVSRRVGYKWLARFEEEGAAGLFERSRAPLHHPQAIAEGIAERCLEVRRAHPTWGPVKVRAYLARCTPKKDWPAASTIGGLFDREGLTVKRKLRRRSPSSSAPFAHCAAANDVWCIDFKGWFLTGDGKRCEPLTLSDAYSRYLLRCQDLRRSDTDHVWPVLDAAFREFGLRSDNGSPFASRGAGGLSRLSVKLIKAGVMPERIAPGKPQQNGRHERMHLTLKQEATRPAAANLLQQQAKFDAFLEEFNNERPHEALGMKCPAELYAASCRPYRGIQEPSYPFHDKTVVVTNCGRLCLYRKKINLSTCLAGQAVGIKEVDDGIWLISFMDYDLGYVDLEEKTLQPLPNPFGPKVLPMS